MRIFLSLRSYGPWLVGVGGVLAAGGGAIAGMGFRKAQCSTNWDENRSVFPKWDYNWDKREPYSLVRQRTRKRSSGDKPEESEESYQDQLEKKKCKAIRHIILVRHGQYNLKVSDDSTHTLTDLGQRQAQQTGKRLEALGIDYDSLTSSTMIRAIQTAELIQKELSSKNVKCFPRDPMLNEGVPASPDPPATEWSHDLSDAFTDGARIEAAFRKYFHRASPKQQEDSYEIIVCHGNVIRYFVCRALQFPGDAWLRISLKHASLTCLSILPSGRVILRSVGESGHLPADLMTVS